MTSLVQAERINSSGVYVVGQLVCKGESSTERGRGLSQDSVVTLTVQDKTYSLDDLRDLQSKLMLIAGKAEKGKDEVDKFAKVSQFERLKLVILVFLHFTFGIR